MQPVCSAAIHAAGRILRQPARSRCEAALTDVPLLASVCCPLSAAEPTASWNLDLINARFDLAVGLFAGGLDSPELLAWSNMVTVEDKAAYMHGKLARWHEDDQMMVHFQSKTLSGKAAVRYGFNASSLTKVVAATSRTYTRSDLCHPSPGATWGWHDPGYFHRSLLSGLPTDGKTKVFYQYGDDVLGWSPVLSFSATLGADPSATVNVILVADKGVSFNDSSSFHWAEPQAWMTARGMEEHAKQGYNMILHAGDIAYATGIEIKWEAFETEMDKVYQTGAPYMVG